jgi:phenylacetate-CoA ligase
MNPLHAWQTLRDLRRRVRMSPDELRRLQSRRLKRLAAYAYAQVPYYRRLFDSAGVTPEQIQTVDDLRHIPITRKDSYRATPQSDRIASNMMQRGLLSQRTGGSTGIPLDVYFTAEEYDYHALLTLRSELEVGVSLQHHAVIIDAVSPNHQVRWFERLGILRKSFIDLWMPLPSQVAQLRRMRPSVLIGYATHVRLLAQYARANGIRDVQFEYVFTTSEPLTEESRALIEEAFGTKVYARYDAWETFLIGWECERHEGWHMDEDHLVVECLKDGEQTVGPGEVVVTNLDFHAMPLLRYALDDVATLDPKPCPCGRSFARIRTLHGRSPDVIRLPDGRMLDMLVVNLIFKHMEGVNQYRLVQETADAFRLEIVPAPDFSQSLLSAVAMRFVEHCGRGLSLRVEMVDRIPHGPSGKRDYLVSELQRAGNA